MDKPKVTPKDFFLWAGAMVSLYGGVIAFVSLLFDYISTAFPNPIREGYYYGDPYFNSISRETATLLVLTPLFMALMRLIRREIARDPSRGEIWVRRWALMLTLFLAGAAMAIDVIIALTTFLQGEDLTAAFLLKVLVVLLVAGAGFLHFLADIRGYWQKESAKAKMVNWAVGVLVLAAIAAGFFIVGTPQDVRRLKQDAARVQDLQNIQWQVVNYWQQKGALPESIAALKDPISPSVIPSDPKTDQAYGYEKTGAMSFRLCADFERESMGEEGLVTRPLGNENENWQHGSGRQCFDRTIDPELYPVYEGGRAIPAKVPVAAD